MSQHCFVHRRVVRGFATERQMSRRFAVEDSRGLAVQCSVNDPRLEVLVLPSPVAETAPASMFKRFPLPVQAFSTAVYSDKTCMPSCPPPVPVPDPAPTAPPECNRLFGHSPPGNTLITTGGSAFHSLRNDQNHQSLRITDLPILARAPAPRALGVRVRATSVSFLDSLPAQVTCKTDTSYHPGRYICAHSLLWPCALMRQPANRAVLPLPTIEFPPPASWPGPFRTFPTCSDANSLAL